MKIFDYLNFFENFWLTRRYVIIYYRHNKITGGVQDQYVHFTDLDQFYHTTVVIFTGQNPPLLLLSLQSLNYRHSNVRKFQFKSLTRIFR